MYNLFLKAALVTALLHFSPLEVHGQTVISVKLVDKDGDGLVDEDRKRSKFPSGAFFYRSVNRNDGVASGFVVGRRSITTVAHVFLSHDRQAWRFNPHDGLYVWVEACNRRYEVVNVSLGTMITRGNGHKDYAVATTGEDICSAADPLYVGGTDLFDVTKERIGVVGYYRPSSIRVEEERQRAGLIEPIAPENPNEKFEQYASFGHIFEQLEIAVDQRGRATFTDMDRLWVRPQRMLKYEIGQSYGGSGGPLFTVWQGKATVVGMQYRQPHDKNHNFGIETSGDFLDFLIRNVPDLKVLTH